MKSPDEPVRLSSEESDASPTLRALLSSADLDAPTARERARMDAGLAALLGTPASIAAPATAATSKTLVGAVGLLAATLGVVAGVALVVTLREPARPVGGDHTTSPEPPAAPPGPSPAAIEEPPGPDEAEAEPPPEPSERPAVEPSGAPVRPAAPAARAGGAGPEEPEGDGYELVDEAQRRLAAGDLAGSLAVAEEHRRRHPAGAFTEEREAIVIEVLVRTGRRDAARRRLDRFLAAYPQSGYRSRLTHLVDVPPR